MNSETDNKDKVAKWLKKITKAEKAYEDYHNLVKEIRKYYKNEGKNKQNIFWSSVETLKPFLYFKQPKPYIERKDKSSNPLYHTACSILEKALEWDLSQFDFDSVIKYARNDFLLSGMGLAYEKYSPNISQAELDGQIVDLVDSEKVDTVYIDPVDFIADSAKVGIWENVTWWARKIHMTKDEVIDQFGDDLAVYLKSDNDKEDKNTLVYEVWDKESKSVLYICPDYKADFLMVKEDLLKVEGFFPMPKPIFATQTNDSLIPVPDYSEIKPLLDELDGVTRRMKNTMQALKVSGCYDNSFPELSNILDKDVSLISLSDFDRLKEAGGIQGIIDFAPIDQYITALETLATRRQDLIQAIYEITGVSDIMRGNSDPNETATAVNKKTNFGTLRNQDRQNDMQRFITDLFRIKADVICEMFSEEALAQFLPEGTDNETALQAIALLKTDKMRGMVLGIETDTSFNQEGIAEQSVETIKLMNDLINGAFATVSGQPKLLPLYRQMIETVTSTLPNARQYEPVIEQVFSQIQEELANPQQEEPNPEMLKVQLQQQEMQLKYQDEAQKNKLKEMQLQIELAKLNQDGGLKNKEMDLQADLKVAEMAQNERMEQNREVGNNIPTGYVKGFK